MVAIAKHVIDCDADPLCPKGWTVKEHNEGGQFEWDPAKVELFLVELFLSEKQNEGFFGGYDLHEELKDKAVLNANVLDYLLEHPELIPKEWKDRYVYFWGTIYRDSDGRLNVRYLRWDGSRWYWWDYWLGNDWRGNGARLRLPASSFSPLDLRLLVPLDLRF